MDKCPVCGKPVIPNTTNCANCGINFAPAFSTKTKAGIALVVLAVLWIVFKPSSHKEGTTATASSENSAPTVNPDEPILKHFQEMSPLEQENYLYAALDNNFATIGNKQPETLVALFSQRIDILLNHIYRLHQHMEDAFAKIPNDGQVVHFTSDADYVVQKKWTDQLATGWKIVDDMPSLSPLAEGYLRNILSLPNSYRYKAFQALMKITRSDPEQVTLCIELATDRDMGIRRGAIKKLGEMGPRAINALPFLQNLDSELEKPNVRINSVTSSSGRRVVAVVQPSPYLQRPDIGKLDISDLERTEIKRTIQKIQGQGVEH